MRTYLLLLACLLAATTVFAQRGDRPGETQNPPNPSWVIPSAPVLSPTEALAAFQIEEGFRVELVAAEPLVEDPVCMAFDALGRLFVVEMRGYMPDVDGFAEDSASGQIVVLTDTNGDGVMDTSTVFAEDLVLPRGIAFSGDDVLVIEPPYIRRFRDTDGDLIADEDDIVTTGMAGLENPEHAGNGLILGMDNRFHLAKHPISFRFRHGAWDVLEQPPVGQWGITQDDEGRWYFNTNSAQLRGAAFPLHYAERNPAIGAASGADFNVVSDQRVWPARITPGVNRGYDKGTLRRDGRLARYTAACGPGVYRGDTFPREYRGNVFVCEPAGNLVTRNIVDTSGLRMKGSRAAEGREFLTSTDERFRPVNIYTGPDGNLYICDFYRGIIQHKTYVTTYLRKQILERKLETPVGLGRIWRIVPTTAKKAPFLDLSQKSEAELVQLLAHEGGWIRETAQRLIVHHQLKAAVPPLCELVTNSPSPLARLHGLWCLEGLDALTPDLLQRALSDSDRNVRIAALRVSETFAQGTDAVALRQKIYELAKDPEIRVRHQLLLSLGEIPTKEALAVMAEVLLANPESVEFRQAALSGLKYRELDLLGLLLEDSSNVRGSKGVAAILSELALSVGRGYDPVAAERLLTSAAMGSAWQTEALVGGLVKSRPARPKKQRPLRLTAAPKAYDTLSAHESKSVRKLVSELEHFITWPGRPGYDAMAVRPLSDDERARFERGRQQYLFSCAGCHQRSGGGAGGLAPPLAGSEWVDGPVSRIARIALQGLEGKVTVKGRSYELAMPPQAALTDAQLADVFTYIRREWGNEGDPVLETTIKKVRAETEGRSAPWTEAELLKLED